MPYSTIDDLPESIRNVLPDDAQRRFMAVANAYLADNKTDSQAMAAAWKVVSNGWEKGRDGKWHRKRGLDSAVARAGIRKLLDRLNKTGGKKSTPGSTFYNRWPAGNPKGGQFAPKAGISSTAQQFKFSGAGSWSGGASLASKFWVPGSGSSAGSLTSPAKPPGPPPGAKPHPRKDDKGNPVTVNYPTKPSDPSTWTDATKTATFAPGGQTPVSLNGVRMEPWNAPKSLDGWKTVAGTMPELDDIPFDAPETKSIGAGVLIVEPDGRIWLTRPTNAYGGYNNTFPKGTVEQGLTLQQSAIKEAFEETGLRVEITGMLGDYERDTSVARMFVARRVGGTPRDMGWESQGVRLATFDDAAELLNRSHDKMILGGLRSDLEAVGLLTPKITKAAYEKQPRWAAGTPVGGRWKEYDTSGLVKPPKMVYKHHQMQVDALYAMAAAGKIESLKAAAAAKQYAITAVTAQQANKKLINAWLKSTAAVAYYGNELLANIRAKTKAQASADAINGPVLLSSLTKVGPKPGGSNPGAMYQTASGEKVLVKGSNTASLGPAEVEKRSRNEVLASKLMAATGLAAPEMGLVDLQGQHGGGIGISSKWKEGLKPLGKNAADIAAAQADFAVHAWLANYDAIGLERDNTLITPDGKAICVDPGGSMKYRAQGKEKPFTNSAVEFDSMRDPKINAMAASVYGSMTASQISDSAKKLSLIDDETIRKLCASYGPGTLAERADLAVTLIARRADILKRVEALTAGSAATPQPDEAPASTPVKQPKQSRGSFEIPTFVETSPGVVDNYKHRVSKLLAWHKEKNLALLEEYAGSHSFATTENGKKLKAFVKTLIADLKNSTMQIAADLKAPKAIQSEPPAKQPVPKQAVSLSIPAFVETFPGALDVYNKKASMAVTAYTTKNLAWLEKVAATKFAATENGKKMQAFIKPMIADLKGQGLQAAEAKIAPVVNVPSVGVATSTSKAAMPDPNKFKKQIASNENATTAGYKQTHNKKIDVLSNLAKSGDIKGIISLAYASNATFGQVQIKYANDILAALGSDLKVGVQKSLSHPALAAAGIQKPAQIATPPAASPVKGAAPAAAAPSQPWLKMRAGETIIEQGEKFGVEYAIVQKQAQGFDASKIPNTPDFFANGSQGPNKKWKSSIEAVNKANNDAVFLVYQTALAQKTAAAVANLEFSEISKETGAPTGKKLPFSQHPSALVKEYWSNVQAEIKAQLAPTIKTYQNGSFSAGYAQAAAQLAALHKTVSYEGFKTHANKAADYLVLSKNAAASLTVPETGSFVEFDKKQNSEIHFKFKKESDAAIATLSSSQKTAIEQYTGSAYDNMNSALRLGNMNSSAWAKAQTMVKAFKKAAVEIPEGTIIWRGLSVGQSIYESVTGGVIQDGSFNSASYGERPRGPGSSAPTWLRIHVAKGVKGLNVTSISHYDNLENEIVISNNVRYAVLNVQHHDKWVDSKGISHGGRTIVDVIALPHD